MPKVPVPGALGAGDRARLEEVLGHSRDLGFLGPGPVADHVDHSLAMLPLLDGLVGAGWAGRGSDERPAADPGLWGEPIQAIDLGSGGGLPGLPLALATPTWRWALLDGSVTRTAWLAEAVSALDLGHRVEVVTARAEEAARGPWRGGARIVVARGFAAPAATAECAAPLLVHGGVAVITEPPGGDPSRWPDDGLATLGLERAGTTTWPVALQALRKVGHTPDRYPRRTGIPGKRPLW